MQPANDTDYKQLFTQLIKKQMLILGPEITLAKVKNVSGITVDPTGEVQNIEGDPQQLLQALINQFVELSGLIVKKTMESILTSYPGMMAMASSMGVAVGASTTSGGAAQAATVASQPETTTTGIPVTSSLPETLIKTDIPAAPSEPLPHQESVSQHPELVPQHQEPPSMSAMNLDSLSVQPNKPAPKASDTTSFSEKEMQDLNKALEDLSKTPLSTENAQPPTQPTQ